MHVLAPVSVGREHGFEAALSAHIHRACWLAGQSCRIADLDRLDAFVARALADLATQRRTIVVDVITGDGDDVRPDPVRAMCVLLGIPAAHTPRVARWAAAASVDPAVLAQLCGYIDVLVAVRCGAPTSDLLTALIHAEHDGDELDSDDMRVVVAALLCCAAAAAR